MIKYEIVIQVADCAYWSFIYERKEVVIAGADPDVCVIETRQIYESPSESDTYREAFSMATKWLKTFIEKATPC